MNPLRLATLDASPFCCAKRGGAPLVLLTFPPLAGETLMLCKCLIKGEGIRNV